MTKQLVIRLPNGRRCTVGEYVLSWYRLQRMSPHQEVSGFSWWPERVDVVLRQIRLAVHDRINRHVQHYGVGRKWSEDWQRAARHCANEVNTPRLIVRWVPQDLRAQLAHRLYTAD